MEVLWGPGVLDKKEVSGDWGEFPVKRLGILSGECRGLEKLGALETAGEP